MAWCVTIVGTNHKNLELAQLKEVLIMTWVVGGITPFGYGIAISDIRVTFEDGTHRDCLQKIYPVGNFIVAGFAGSVDIGFALIKDLRNFLTLDDPNEAWIPEWVAVNWRARASRIFRAKPQNEQRLTSEIILIGIHPNKDNGPFPTGRVCVLKSPNFKHSFADNYDVKTIGSGSNIEDYVESAQKSTNMFGNPLLQGEINRPGGFGQTIAIQLTQMLQKKLDPNVSQYLHVSNIGRGKLSIYNNNYISSGKNGSIKEFKMPWVAQNYFDFKNYCQKRGQNSAQAFC